MRSRELIDAGPIRIAIADLDELAKVAHELTTEALSERVREMSAQFSRAIAIAENPTLDDGLSVREYAAVHSITKAAAYKRIQRKKLPTKRVPGVGLVILEKSA